MTGWRPNRRDPSARTEDDAHRAYRVNGPTRPHHSPAPGQPRGIAGMRQVWCQLRGQFPDVCIEINDLIAEGHRVVARGTFLSGGGRLGRFLEVFQIQDGRITDVWNILTFDRGWGEYGSALWLQR